MRDTAPPGPASQKLSEAEVGAERQAAKTQVVDEFAVVLAVIQIAVVENDVAPLEGIADTGHALPGEGR